MRYYLTGHQANKRSASGMDDSPSIKKYEAGAAATKYYDVESLGSRSFKGG